MTIRDQIRLTDSKRALDKVHVPEWECDVFVRVMSGHEREYVENMFAENKGSQKLRATLVCMCLAEENGNRVFLDSEIDEVSKLSGNALDRIWDAAMRLNRLLKESIDDEKKTS